MKLKHTFRTALSGLSTHKSRSLLTTLGIVIGIAAIIVVMALGQGAQAMILGTISSLGAETAVIQPGGPGSDFGEELLSHTITKRDVTALRRKGNVPNLADYMPMVFVSANASYEDEIYKPSITGGDADFFIETFDAYPERGVPFTKEDIDARARVAIIGVKVEDELFGESGDAVGKLIKLKDDKFRVVGVFPPIGSLGFFNVDETVLVPYTTAQTYLTGDDTFNQILLKADSPDNVDKMAYDVKATIRETHDIDFGEDDDFTVQTQQALVDQISTVVTILTSFLAAVVAISLVVGGVGIMNIMLVSVTERTKEIGLRKALGATRGDILWQFLLEAVMLTASGGLIGIVLGGLVAFLVSLGLKFTVAPDWEFVFPLGAAIIGVVVSAGVGLVFGIYPAAQAGKKSPIEALRYE